MTPTKYGKGYLGIGPHIPTVNNKATQAYAIWSAMLRRCYSDKWHNKYPTYTECAVHVPWLNFQIFAEWFNIHYVEDYQLDKDLLVKGNKLYTPDTVCFIPHEINLILSDKNTNKLGLPQGVSINSPNTFKATLYANKIKRYLGSFNTPELAFQAYKQAKELYIKEIANRYKSTITQQAYQALIDYQVEISD